MCLCLDEHVYKQSIMWKKNLFHKTFQENPTLIQRNQYIMLIYSTRHMGMIYIKICIYNKIVQFVTIEMTLNG